jgi:hypothetical protein
MSLHPADWHRVLRRYFVLSVFLHLGWELLQLPLYTMWATDPLLKQAFAVGHCTIGDAMIAGLTLLIALSVAGNSHWPAERWRAVWITTVVLGMTYTIYSEWLNINVRGNWAYAASMPTLPFIGTGLAPLLQWLVVPSLALLSAGRARR